MGRCKAVPAAVSESSGELGGAARRPRVQADTRRGSRSPGVWSWSKITRRRCGLRAGGGCGRRAGRWPRLRAGRLAPHSSASSGSSRSRWRREPPRMTPRPAGAAPARLPSRRANPRRTRSSSASPEGRAQHETESTLPIGQSASKTPSKRHKSRRVEPWTCESYTVFSRNRACTICPRDVLAGWGSDLPALARPDGEG